MFFLREPPLIYDDEILKRYSKVLNGKERALYLENKETIKKKKKTGKKILEKCILCERRCGVNRFEKVGECGVKETKISSLFKHMGEEPELVPSWTVFFSGCNLKCVFCQNWDISQNPSNGRVISPKEITEKIINIKARNVNWVGGDPIPNIVYILFVLSWLDRNIPQVFNSNMFMTEESMDLLDGLIDIYLTDLKYGNNDCGKRLSKVNNYFDVVSRNHMAANKTTELIIRHLMLPGHYECCTVPIIRWIIEHLDTSRLKLNIMAQYHVDYNARKYTELDDIIDMRQYSRARDLAGEYGIPLTS